LVASSLNIDSLRKQGDFARMRKSELKAITKPCIISCSDFIMESEELSVRRGLIVSKKNGNAVKRNRIKRRLRVATSAIIKENQSLIDGRALVFIARPACLEMTFPDIMTELRKGFRYLSKILKNNGTSPKI